MAFSMASPLMAFVDTYYRISVLSITLIAREMRAPAESGGEPKAGISSMIKSERELELPSLCEHRIIPRKKSIIIALVISGDLDRNVITSVHSRTYQQFPGRS